MAKLHQDRALRLETVFGQRIERFHQRDQRALVVHRAAAIDVAIDDLASERRAGPVAFGPDVHRHHILVRHQK